MFHRRTGISFGFSHISLVIKGNRLRIIPEGKLAVLKSRIPVIQVLLSSLRLSKAYISLIYAYSSKSLTNLPEETIIAVIGTRQ